LQNNSIDLIHLTGIFISAKYYEKDSRGPTAIDIQECFHKKY